MIYLSGFSVIGGSYCLCVYIFSIMTKSHATWPCWPQHRRWLLSVSFHFFYYSTCFKGFGSLSGTTRMHVQARNNQIT